MLDSLLLTALLFISLNKVNNEKEILRSNYVFAGNKRAKEYVIDFIISIYNEKQSIFKDNNHYFHNIMNGLSISGGKFTSEFKPEESLSLQLESLPLKSQPSEFEKELEELKELYKNTYYNKETNLKTDFLSNNKELEELLSSESTGGFNKNKKKYIRKLKRY